MKDLTAAELFANGATHEFGELYHIPAAPASQSVPPPPVSSDSASASASSFSQEELALFSFFDPTIASPSTKLLDPIAQAKEKRDALYLFAKHVGKDLRLPFYKSRGLYDADDDRGPDPDPPPNQSTSSVRHAGKGQGKKVGMRVSPRSGEVVDTLAGKEGGWKYIDPKLIMMRGGALDAEMEGGGDGNETMADGKWQTTADPKRTSRAEEEELLFPASIRSRPDYAPSVGAWVAHNGPLLEEYARRQICPPLSERVNVELTQPSQFITGMLQMLSNRDPENSENIDPSRTLSPQLLDGFTNINRWASEYFRGRFGQDIVGDNVPLVLTILTNNFYEAHMRVTDRIVERAMKNMRQRKGAKLEVEDFAFGFDLHMSQEIPFFVEANHRVRDTLEAHRPRSPTELPASEPLTTRYGRLTKMTKQAEVTAQTEQEKLLKARRKSRAGLSEMGTGLTSMPSRFSTVPGQTQNQGRDPSQVQGGQEVGDSMEVRKDNDCPTSGATGTERSKSNMSCTRTPLQSSRDSGARNGARPGPIGSRDHWTPGHRNSAQTAGANIQMDSVLASSLPQRRASIAQETGLRRPENTSISVDSRHQGQGGSETNVQGTDDIQASPAPGRGRAQSFGSGVVTRSRSTVANSRELTNLENASNTHDAVPGNPRLGPAQHRPVSGFPNNQAAGEVTLTSVEKPRTKKRKVEA